MNDWSGSSLQVFGADMSIIRCNSSLVTELRDGKSQLVGGKTGDESAVDSRTERIVAVYASRNASAVKCDAAGHDLEDERSRVSLNVDQSFMGSPEYWAICQSQKVRYCTFLGHILCSQRDQRES